MKPFSSMLLAVSLRSYAWPFRELCYFMVLFHISVHFLLCFPRSFFSLPLSLFLFPVEFITSPLPFNKTVQLHCSWLGRWEDPGDLPFLARSPNGSDTSAAGDRPRFLMPTWRNVSSSVHGCFCLLAGSMLCSLDCLSKVLGLVYKDFLQLNLPWLGLQNSNL